PPWPMNSRISNWGKEAVTASRVGGVGVGRACPTPVSVGAATPRSRHFGQRPSGALAGMTAPQFGHRLAGAGLLITHLFPDTSAEGCYRKLCAPDEPRQRSFDGSGALFESRRRVEKSRKILLAACPCGCRPEGG